MKSTIPNQHSPMSASGLAGATAADPSPAEETRGPQGPKAAVQELHLRRLQEYLEQSLADRDPEVAMLGAANVQLMQMLLLLNASLERAMNEGLNSEEQFDVVLRVIDATLRLTRQIEGLSKLRHWLRETRQTLLSAVEDRSLPSPI